MLLTAIFAPQQASVLFSSPSSKAARRNNWWLRFGETAGVCRGSRLITCFFRTLEIQSEVQQGILSSFFQARPYMDIQETIMRIGGEIQKFLNQVLYCTTFPQMDFPQRSQTRIQVVKCNINVYRLNVLEYLLHLYHFLTFYKMFCCLGSV